MAMFDQTDATNLLAAILTATAYTTVTATHIRLGTSAPTATVNMTELAGGTGYTTGGSSISWNAVSAAATSNSGSVSWTNASGGNWVLVGLEIWDTAGSPLRHLFGTWTGQPVTISNGNTFQVSAAAVAVSLVLQKVATRYGVSDVHALPVAIRYICIVLTPYRSARSVLRLTGFPSARSSRISHT